MSLGKTRCDGLGYFFPLAFTIHAAAPGAAATICAYQLGGEYRWPLVGLSSLAWLGVVLLWRHALKKKARIEALDRLEQTGWRTTATVMASERLLGNAKSGGVRFVRYKAILRIAPPGRAPWDVENVAWYLGSEARGLGPGAIVEVAVSHEDPREVLVLRVPPPQEYGAHVRAPTGMLGLG